jgi:hypothetical protein
MKIATAITLTNPNDSNNRYIDVRLHNDNKEYKAVFINPLNLDHREQKPNIKVGSEVFVLLDDLHNIYVLGTTQQGISLVDKKIYIVENENEIRLLTNDLLNISAIDGGKIEDVKLNANKTDFQTTKFKVQNDTAELLKTLSDTIQAFIDLPIVIGNLGQPATITPDLDSKLSELKSKIDSFI